jgi:hypothetical protein
MVPYLLLSSSIHQGTGALAIEISEMNVIKPLFAKEDVKLYVFIYNLITLTFY